MLIDYPDALEEPAIRRRATLPYETAIREQLGLATIFSLVYYAIRRDQVGPEFGQPYLENRDLAKERANVFLSENLIRLIARSHDAIYGIYSSDNGGLVSIDDLKD
jgi:hypothetical protein